MEMHSHDFDCGQRFLSITALKTHHPSNSRTQSFPSQSLSYILGSHQVGRIPKALKPNKRLLNAPCRHKAGEERDTTRLVVRPAGTTASKRLLSDNRTRALFVVVYIPCSVSERICSFDERGAILRKAWENVGQREKCGRWREKTFTWRRSGHSRW